MKTYKQLQERINMARAKMGDVIKDFQQSDAPQFKGKSQEKRRQMAIAAKMAAEEVELEEGRMKEIAMDMETLGDKEFKAKHKKSKQDMKDALKSEELKGDQHKIDANKNGKIDGHDFKLLRSKKKVEEEVEELDELSKATLASYAKKAKHQMGHDYIHATQSDRHTPAETRAYAKRADRRYDGIDKAINKLAKEEVELEESDLKPFIVVHAKHGKFETHAASTYEAAKNAAAHWKTKKGTSGMDVHRADITHSTQHVG